MKNWIFSLSIFCTTFFVVTPVMAQQSQGPSQQSSDIKTSLYYRIQKGIYNRALKYNDMDMAINALYHLTVMEPQNDSLLFSLAYLYFDSQKFFSSVLTLNDVLMLNPDNIPALEMKAVSLESIGATEKALEAYESLYLKSDENINFLYKVAVFQYDLKRYGESKTNIDILLSKPASDEIKYYFPTEDNQQQEIPMRASLHNMKGLIAKESGNMNEAKKQFGLALEIAPDFYMAKKNLSEISNN
jgi:tetratricopeptide (TPR) repeat protein